MLLALQYCCLLNYLVPAIHKQKRIALATMQKNIILAKHIVLFHNVSSLRFQANLFLFLCIC